MGDGIKIFVPQGGQIAQMDASIDAGGVLLAAIDSNVVAALGQPHRDFFGKRFEPAVIRGDAACS